MAAIIHLFRNINILVQTHSVEGYGCYFSLVECTVSERFTKTQPFYVLKLLFLRAKVRLQLRR